jgi:hypothetical protein
MDRVYYFPSAIDPNSGQIEKGEEHGDGCVYTVVFAIRQHQALVFTQSALKTKPQFFAKRSTPFGFCY